MEDSRNEPDDNACPGNFSPHDEGTEGVSREDLVAELAALRAEMHRHSEIGKIRTGLTRAIYHDLKSPINTVISLIDIVLEESFGELNERQKDFLRRAENGLYRLVSLVESCLDLERVEGEMFDEKLDDLLIEEVLKPVVKNLRERAEKKKQELSLDIEKGMPSITAGERGLRHVFQNLIGNAIKYTPEKGKIEVRAMQEGDYLLVKVKDNGVGISGEDISKIFNPFYRCKGADKLDNTGTGLGLSITKMILDTSNGRIDVESEPGKGSVFKVYYPFHSIGKRST